MPVITLKTVVLPAPFGPMMLRISPCVTLNDTVSMARKPPKSLLSEVTLSRAMPVTSCCLLNRNRWARLGASATADITTPCRRSGMIPAGRSTIITTMATPIRPSRQSMIWNAEISRSRSGPN